MVERDNTNPVIAIICVCVDRANRLRATQRKGVQSMLMFLSRSGSPGGGGNWLWRTGSSSLRIRSTTNRLLVIAEKENTQHHPIAYPSCCVICSSCAMHRYKETLCVVGELPVLPFFFSLGNCTLVLIALAIYTFGLDDSA